MNNPDYYENGTEESGYNGPGWYFNDETFYLHGPYLTELEANLEFKNYMTFLDSKGLFREAAKEFLGCIGLIIGMIIIYYLLTSLGE